MSPQLLEAAPAPVRVIDLTRPVPVMTSDEVPVVVRRRRRPLHHRLARLVSGLLLAVLALAAVTGAVLVVTWKLAFAPVLSGSMEPSFSPGDLIVTRALDAQRIAVGDVVVLPVPDAPGQRFVHRVVEVTHEDDGLPVVRTKGDNNPAADAWALRIDSAQVPLVVADVPDAGRLALLTQGVALRIALIVGVAVLALVGVKRALLD